MNQYVVACHVKKKHGFSCEMCEFFSKSKIEFIEHKKIHPKYFQPRNCKIEDCNFVGSKYYLMRHMEDMHTYSGPGFKCPVCGKLSKNRNCLSSHMSRQHRGISSKNVLPLPSPSDANLPLPRKLLVPKLISK